MQRMSMSALMGTLFGLAEKTNDISRTLRAFQRPGQRIRRSTFNKGGDWRAADSYPYRMYRICTPKAGSTRRFALLTTEAVPEWAGEIGQVWGRGAKNALADFAFEERKAGKKATAEEGVFA